MNQMDAQIREIINRLESDMEKYELEWTEVQDAIMQVCGLAYLAGIEDGARMAAKAMMAR